MKWRKVTGGYAATDSNEVHWEIRHAWRASRRVRGPVRSGWHLFQNGEWASGPYATIGAVKAQFETVFVDPSPRRWSGSQDTER